MFEWNIATTITLAVAYSGMSKSKLKPEDIHPHLQRKNKVQKKLTPEAAAAFRRYITMVGT